MGLFDIFKKKTAPKKEVEKTYTQPNKFFKNPVDYRGQYISEPKGEK